MATDIVGSTAYRNIYAMTHYLCKAVAFSNVSAAVTVGKLPAGAMVINAGVVVTTVFNAATTNTIDIGTSGTPASYASAISLGVVGRILADDLGISTQLYNATADVTVTATVAATGAAATTGAGFVFVEFVLPANA